MVMIRYPGSKEKLAAQIRSYFPDAFNGELFSGRGTWEYREPFFGSGAIGFRVLRRISHRCRIWLNDIDPGIAALWQCVRDDEAHRQLMVKVRRFTPNPETFYTFKEEDGRHELPIDQAAFRKLVLHRISYSGLGAMAGGPIGGKQQGNERYDVGCRWNAETINDLIRTLHHRLRAFQDCRITSLDFGELIKDAPEECFIYVDPPYYAKGPELYKHSMSVADHERLASLLLETRASWVLSYDDHEEVRRLYQGCSIHEVGGESSYTIASTTKKRPKNREIVIIPRRPDSH
jgi:DNA adenine methylase